MTTISPDIIRTLFLHPGVYSINVIGSLVRSGVAVPDGPLDLGTITAGPNHP